MCWSPSPAGGLAVVASQTNESWVSRRRGKSGLSRSVPLALCLSLLRLKVASPGRGRAPSHGPHTTATPQLHPVPTRDGSMPPSPVCHCSTLSPHVTAPCPHPPRHNSTPLSPTCHGSAPHAPRVSAPCPCPPRVLAPCPCPHVSWLAHSCRRRASPSARPASMSPGPEPTGTSRTRMSGGRGTCHWPCWWVKHPPCRTQ